VIGTSVSLTGQQLINGITTANTYTPRVNAPSQVISLSPVNLPGLNLSTPRRVGDPLPTAVAGQAAFVDGSLAPSAIGNLGPQDLLNNLPSNLQPGSTLFYYNPQEEDVMLQQAALQQTGKASFIDGLSYDSTSGATVTEQEKAYLYQNAIDYAKTNNLQLGDALTQAQVSELDKPMLWYVEQTVPDPSCKATGNATCPTITALMPQVYLPSDTSAMSAGGNISGTDVTLNFNQDGNGSILNTGSISASDTLTVNTGTLTNQANQVDIGQDWSKVKGGYVDTTGTVVQPGGFMSAANMDLNVETLNQIGGVLQQLNADGTVDEAGTQQMLAQLQQQLGVNFTQTSVSDNLHTDFVKEGGGLPTFVVAAIAIAASIVTAGAAAAALGVVMTQLTVGSVLVGALGGMVGSIAGQLASGQGLNFGQILEAGAIGGLTAGAFAGLSEAGMGIGNLQGIAGKLANGTFGAADLGNALETIAARGVVSAGIDTAVYGGSFGEALEGSLIGDIGAVGAGAIGFESTQNPLMAEGTPGYVLAHAALGCVLSAADGTGCGGGAVGGAASAIATPVIRDGLYDGSETVTYGEDANGAPIKTVSYDNPALNAATASIAALIGGELSNLLGQNPGAGANWAVNEALNNSLSTKTVGVPLDTSAMSEAEKERYEDSHSVPVVTINDSGAQETKSGGEIVKSPPPITGGSSAGGAGSGATPIGGTGGGATNYTVVATFGPMNPGPLSSETANTFRSGTYTEMVAQQPTTLYRGYGGTADQMGGYWTPTPPAGPVQSTIDSALLPQWGNTATNVVKIEIPAGTTYFTGAAAPQGGLVGGGTQVVFPPGFKVNSSWIKSP
jgi:filamentous hemagglutinin